MNEMPVAFEFLYSYFVSMAVLKSFHANFGYLKLAPSFETIFSSSNSSLLAKFSLLFSLWIKNLLVLFRRGIISIMNTKFLGVSQDMESVDGRPR